MDKNIAAFLRPEAKTVAVRFFQDKFKDIAEKMTLLGDEVSLSPQAYTYVTDLNVQVGDLVIVYAVSVPKVVMVVQVDNNLDLEPNDTVEYKWVVAKVDMSPYIDNCKKNALINRTIAKAYKNNMRKQFTDLFFASMDEDSRKFLASVITPKDELVEKGE